MEIVEKEWADVDLTRFDGRKLKTWEFQLERERHERRALRAVHRALARDRARKRKQERLERRVRKADAKQPERT